MMRPRPVQTVLTPAKWTGLGNGSEPNPAGKNITIISMPARTEADATDATGAGEVGFGR